MSERRRRGGGIAVGSMCVMIGASWVPAWGGPPPGGAPAVEPGGVAEAFTQEIPGTAVVIEMTPVPGGTLEYADPADPGRVIAVEVAPFYMSTTEVTWDAYDVFVFALDQPDPTRPADADVISRPSKPYLPPDRGFGHAGYPALSMTHHAAEQYCVWLSAKTGRTYRLATEDEWEWACRAGSAEAFSFAPDGGEIEGDLVDAHAWYSGNSEHTTHPVGALEASAFGLFDMHGNAAEWVDGRDGTPLVAGGSYLESLEAISATARQKQVRAWQASDPQIPRSRWWLSDATHVGFRVVCEVE